MSAQAARVVSALGSSGLVWAHVYDYAACHVRWSQVLNASVICSTIGSERVLIRPWLGMRQGRAEARRDIRQCKPGRRFSQVPVPLYSDAIGTAPGDSNCMPSFNIALAASHATFVRQFI